MENKLFFGDNLDILRRYIEEKSVDLVYLDPPFKSNQDYNVLFAEQNGSRSAAQIRVFEDTWHWDQTAAEAYHEVTENGPERVSLAMRGFRTLLGENDMMAYLAMMAPRLVELRRVLKPTGSIYLHCDPTASHYLKLIMDAVFGGDMFRNEIVWKRTSGRKAGNQYGRIHDILLFYSRSGSATWNPPKIPQDESTIRGHDLLREGSQLYRLSDFSGAGQGPPRRFGNRMIEPPKGRHWMFEQENIDRFLAKGRIAFSRTGMPRLKKGLDELPGKDVTDVWFDIEPINAAAAERLGYPTQKPEALLERIITASSNRGGIVLDPFCGCGTAIAVAERLHRHWIGIDVTHLAVALMKHRLSDMFGGSAKYEVIGEPVSLPDAKALAKGDPFQFQWWALGLVHARPVEQKKGADKGIDGRLYFHDEADSKKAATKQVIFSVKSGKVSVRDVRDLRGVVEREKAEIGVLITLRSATRPMRTEAASAGFYKSPWGTKHPTLQILTVEQLLGAKKVDYPPSGDLRTFKKAPKAKRKKRDHPELDFGD